MIRSSTMLFFLMCLILGQLGCTGADDPNAPVEAAVLPPASKAQIRLLNSDELKSSVSFALGEVVAEEIQFKDDSTGYSTGAGLELTDGLLELWLNESERIAADYSNGKLLQDFECFSDAPVSTLCLESFISSVGKKLFRKSLTPADVQKWVGYFRQSDQPDRLVQRMLLSADFLYRVEAPAESEEMNATRKAEMIAFGLTGAPPDEELMGDAEESELGAESIRSHVGRILASDSGKNHFVGFFKDWLRVGDLDRMSSHPEEYAKLQSNTQGEALKKEFELYVKNTILGSEPSLLGFFEGAHTFVNEDTAPLYGQSLAGSEYQEIELDQEKRNGVLTLASVMAAHSSVSDPERDRPVSRGLLIKNQFFCSQVGLPSGLNTSQVADSVREEHPNFDDFTVRKQFETVMSQGESCQACHSQFMSYGYAFSHYDGLGRHQTEQKGEPIDAVVTNVPIGQSNQNFSSALEMIPELSQNDLVHRCFIRQVLRFVTGRYQGSDLSQMEQTLSLQFSRQSYRFDELLKEIFSMPEMYHREVKDES